MSTEEEFPGDEEPTPEREEPAAYGDPIVNRSLSQGTGSGSTVTSGKKAKSNPQFKIGFEGLNLYQQRYARGGNQFTVEPPDQGLCVGNGFVVEAVNDVLNVFNTSGHSVLPDNTATNIVAGFPRNVNHAVDLNSFYGYAPAIDRTTGRPGPVRDRPELPVRRGDAALLRGRADPRDRADDGRVHAREPPRHRRQHRPRTRPATWNIYRLDVTNDGTNTGGANPGPYLGDYPHIGADANGFYITTNAYPWCCNGFSGAQIYAFSKAQLAAGAASVTMVHIDTSGTVNAPSDAGPDAAGLHGLAGAVAGHGLVQHEQRRHRVLPELERGRRGHASGGRDRRQPRLEPDRRLDPDQHVVAEQRVAVAQLDQQGARRQPVRDPAEAAATRVGHARRRRPRRRATASTTRRPRRSPASAAGGCCSPREPAHNEVISRPDSNDTRMQQVMYANGKLWGALDTALNPDGGPQRAGIAWYIVNPNARASSSCRAISGRQGTTSPTPRSA